MVSRAKCPSDMTIHFGGSYDDDDIFFLAPRRAVFHRCFLWMFLAVVYFRRRSLDFSTLTILVVIIVFVSVFLYALLRICIFQVPIDTDSSRVFFALDDLLDIVVPNFVLVSHEARSKRTRLLSASSIHCCYYCCNQVVLLSAPLVVCSNASVGIDGTSKHSVVSHSHRSRAIPLPERLTTSRHSHGNFTSRAFTWHSHRFYLKP